MSPRKKLLGLLPVIFVSVTATWSSPVSGNSTHLAQSSTEQPSEEVLQTPITGLEEECPSVAPPPTFIFNYYNDHLLKFLRQLEEAREKGDRAAEAQELNDIGTIYSYYNDYCQAIKFLRESLVIRRGIGDLPKQISTLNNLAVAFSSVGQHEDAALMLGEALLVNEELGDRGFALTLYNNLGVSYEMLEEDELAIIFYKQAVNLANPQWIIQDEERRKQGIRRRTSPAGQSYRAVISLLLSQGRILEALQVVEKLKAGELEEFTGERARVFDGTVELNDREDVILREYRGLINFGLRMYQCEFENNCAKSKQDLFAERRSLLEDLDALVQKYKTEIDAITPAETPWLSPTDFKPEAWEIITKRKDKKTALIYPLILGNRLWILWSAAGGAVNVIEVANVDERQLSKKVVDLYKLIINPNSEKDEIKQVGKELYDWLIQPINQVLQETGGKSLEESKIENLVFSLDRFVRYIPMSVLFDGESYLIENFNISTILSAELTDVQTKLPQSVEETSVLGLGLSNPVEGFEALPHVETELKSIIRSELSPLTPSEVSTRRAKTGLFPGNLYLNEAFNRDALELNLSQNNIIHIATHGVFIPDILPTDETLEEQLSSAESPQPQSEREKSYLLLGTGEKMTFEDIRLISGWAEVSMVVLSACETALGSLEQDGDGLEVTSFAYELLNEKVDTVLASLWKVSDASTSQLMQAFYHNLSKNSEEKPVTRAEALRQAQLKLLRPNLEVESDDLNAGQVSSADETEDVNGIEMDGDSTQSSQSIMDGNGVRSAVGIEIPASDDIDPNDGPDFSHPYYWSPFVLIGNGF